MALFLGMNFDLGCDLRSCPDCNPRVMSVGDKRWKLSQTPSWIASMSITRDETVFPGKLSTKLLLILW